MMNGLLSHSLYEWYARAREAAFDAIAMTVDDGALNQLYVATHKDLIGKTDLYFDPIGVVSKHQGVNDKLSKELWDYSLKTVEKFM